MSNATDPASAGVDSGAAVVLDAASIERLPWQRLHGLHDARTRVLWRKGRSLAGILTVAPREELSEHAHPEAHHHVWVLSGSATILGLHVSEGSYVHIPAGMAHAIEDVSDEGLTMLYLFETLD